MKSSGNCTQLNVPRRSCHHSLVLYVCGLEVWGDKGSPETELVLVNAISRELHLLRWKTC